MGDILGDILGGAQNLGGQIASGVNSLGGNVRAGIDNARTQGQTIVSNWGSQAGRVSDDWGSQASRIVRDANRASEQVSRQAQQIDRDIFGGNVGRATDTAYRVATAPVMVPAAVAMMGAGAVADYVYNKRNSASEADGGVTYEHIDEQSGKPMKSGKYAEQQGEVEVSWVEPMSNRPAYKKVADIGLDRKTMSLISEGYDPLQAVDMRIQEETNPRTLRELDWQRLQLAQNKIELSSDYHHWAIGTGKQQSINPFENEGDAMQALKLGSRQESKIQLSKANPGMADIFADLPGGMGLEDASWDAAKTGFTKKSPSFTKAINKALSTRGDPGIYGTLNSDRNYDEWNKARPQAKVTVISPMEILTGTKQRRTIPANPVYASGYKTRTYVPKNAQDELAMLKETGILNTNLNLPKSAVNATRNLTKSKKSAKKQEYFYGI